MNTETSSKAQQPTMDHTAGFRLTDDEQSRVAALKGALAMPVDVEMAKVKRLIFLTGLAALERKNKKGKRSEK